jgi:multicomponent Na+:H+ antiporter subunit F
MPIVLLALSAALLLSVVPALVRLLAGPTAADRMLAVTLLGTTAAAVLLLLSAATDNPSLVDAALIIGLLTAVPVLVFARRVAPGGRR